MTEVYDTGGFPDSDIPRGAIDARVHVAVGCQVSSPGGHDLTAWCFGRFSLFILATISTGMSSVSEGVWAIENPFILNGDTSTDVHILTRCPYRRYVETSDYEDLAS